MQWLINKGHRISTTSSRCHKLHTAGARRLTDIQQLKDWSVEGFRNATNNLQAPVILPRLADLALPASKRWFLRPDDLNASSLQHDYLDAFGDTMVPLELTSTIALGHMEFRRTHAPLSLFLRWTRDAPKDSRQRIYLAQCQLQDLPDQLKSDLPVPEIVLNAGKGDIYDSNIWVGRAPTYTPLHRDPNPNLFYQLAGKKVVRMFPPNIGERIFREVRHQLGTSASSSMRGEEMMAGAERIALEQRVWPNGSDDPADEGCQQAILEHGQALFIPLKWWHSIKGLGTGISASVNWWFR